MGLEIERKFLVRVPLLPELDEAIFIKQGYLPTKDHTVVRARIANDQAFLTIKGQNEGTRRLEFEYEIPRADAQQIIDQLCHGKTVAKRRYCIPHGNHTWEVDFFEGRNQGLVVAEVELCNEHDTPEIPPWIGEEVTNDSRYYNANLLDHPYETW